MKADARASFGAQLKALREAAGFTQEELATIAGLSVHERALYEILSATKTTWTTTSFLTPTPRYLGAGIA